MFRHFNAETMPVVFQCRNVKMTIARMQIISASRRTDIPAFYADWFMGRIREGTVSWTNPFGGRRCQASIRPEDVAAIVFWSKNYGPLVPHLDELDRRRYRAIFHFTITGLPKAFEPTVPDASETIATARLLAARYGPDAVLWRYDPVLISSLTGPDYHLKRFQELASALAGSTRRCYFSFPTFYAKVTRNTDRLQSETGIVCQNPPLEQRLELAFGLAAIAADYGIVLYSCCGDGLVQGPIKKARCVDAELLARLCPDHIPSARLSGTRRECGCYESRDIGAYDTCPHGCVYCYANSHKDTAERRWKEHNPAAESLTPMLYNVTG